MSERALGVVSLLKASTRIYYENVFSPFQIGRTIDLLVSLADGSGIRMSSFRSIAEILLTEACRQQAILDGELPAVEPIMIEYGADGGTLALSVTFSFDESRRATLESLGEELNKPDSELDLVRNLRGAAWSASEIVLTVDRMSRRAEILALMPLDAAKPEKPGAIRYIELAGEIPPARPDLEYVELADVEYEKLLDEKSGKGKRDRATAKRIIDAATATGAKNEALLSEEIDRALAAGGSSEDVLGALAKSLAPEQLAEVVKRDFAPEELASLIARSDPGKVANVLADQMSEEELSQLVAESMPPELKAQALATGDPKRSAEIVRKALTKDEVRKVLAEGLSDEDKARVLAEADPGPAAQILRKAMAPDRLAEVLRDALPAEEQAKVLASTLPKKEIADLLTSGLSADRQAGLIADADPLACAKVLRKSLAREEQDKLIANSLTDSEKGRALTASLSPEEIAEKIGESLSPEEQAKALARSMSEEDASDTIRSALSDAEKARVLAQANPEAALEALKEQHSEESLSEILRSAVSTPEGAVAVIRGMPPEELTRIVAGELPQEELVRVVRGAITEKEVARIVRGCFKDGEILEKFCAGAGEEEVARLIKGVVGEKELGKALAEVVPSEDASKHQVSSEEGTENGAEKDDGTKLDIQQIEALLDPSLEPETAMAVLADVLPEGVAESIVSGAIPREDVASALERHLPDPGLARAVASRIVASAKPDADEAVPAESVEIPKSVERELAKLKNSTDFYLRKARDLETKLRSAEERQRRAEQEAHSAKARVERLLSDTVSADDKSHERTSGSSSGQTQGTDQRATPSNAEERAELDASAPAQSGAAREKEALLFFRDKSKELEGELRQAQAEIKRLEAERTKSLLKRAEAPSSSGDSVSEETENSRAEPPGRNKDRVALKAQPTDVVSSEENSGSRGQASVIAAVVQDDEGGDDEGDDTLSRSGGGPEKSGKADSRPSSTSSSSVWESRIRELETKLRASHEEKEKWIEKYQQARLHAAQIETKDNLDPKAPDFGASAEGESDASVTSAGSPGPGRPGRKDSASAKSLDLAAQPRTDGTPLDNRDDSDEAGIKLEKGANDLDHDLDVMTREIEEIKNNLPDDRKRKVVDNMMGEVLRQKAKITEVSREMAATLRRKEYQFRNKEAMLHEELRQSRVVAEQRQSTVDRMKQLMAEMQRKFEREKNGQDQAGSSETQFRLKLEQSQRQVETLNKEIERLNRRALLPSGMSAQGGQSGQQRGTMEAQKQLESAQKALSAKKQELDLMKRQISEKDAKEVEYKRTIMRLQTELNVAKHTTKKSA